MNIFVLVAVMIFQVPGQMQAHVLSSGYTSQEECETARATIVAAADKDGDVVGYNISPCLNITVPNKV